MEKLRESTRQRWGVSVPEEVHRIEKKIGQGGARRGEYRKASSRTCVLRLFLGCGLSLATLAHSPVAQMPETVRIDRLVSLCRVWGAVKYFHPALAYRDIDWDAALVRAIPRIRASSSDGEFAAAVQSMLETLGDPVTRVVDGSRGGAVTDTRHHRRISQLTEGGILVVRLRDFAGTGGSAAAAREFQGLGKRIGEAKGVLFDLRRISPVSEDTRGMLAYIFSEGGFNARLAAIPVVGPGQRSRVHFGFTSQATEISGDYYLSAFTISAGERFDPAEGTKDKPVVFLVNQHSELPTVALALQAARKALIVAEGSASDASLVDIDRIDLGEGVEAEVRVGELVSADGSVGLVADKVVPASAGTDEENEAFQTALELVRHPESSSSLQNRPPLVPASRRDPAYAETSYPSLEFRLLAAFRIRNIIHYFFPYKDLIGEDWDGVLREFIPRMEKATNAKEYHLAVAEMVTHIHDSHGFGSGPILKDYFGRARPPVVVRMIEGLPVITGFLEEKSARKAGAEIGDVVLKVDGEDARSRLERFGRYIPASTPQSLLLNETLRFLGGPEGSVATLTVRDLKDEEKILRMARQSRYPARANAWRSGPVLRLLPGNIGYADLDRLSGLDVERMFNKFRNTRAIIFDMRGYPQETGWSIARRLSEKGQVVAARFDRPLAMFPEGHLEDLTREMTHDTFLQILPPKSGWHYQGKTVMLIDERTISQAEHTGLFFEAANGTRFVGSPTAGADGDVTNFTVPGGITVTFSGEGVRHADGRQLQRLGLIPNLEVRPTLAGIRSGRDEVLEKAIGLLREEEMKSP